MTLRPLLWLTERLDDALRITDFYVERTVGGFLDQAFGISRHTFAAVLLPSLLCALLVLASPSVWRLIAAITLSLAIFVLLAWLMKKSYTRTWPVKVDLVVQAGAVILVSLLIWFLGTDEYREKGLYRHALLPVAVALAFSLLCAAGLLGPMFRRLKGQTRYAGYLTRTELFASRGDAPEVTLGTVLTSLLTASFRAPLALFTPTAIAILLAKPIWVKPVGLIAFLILFFALFIAGLNERFGIMWGLIQEVFFKAGALLVSIVVIVLAAARIAGVTYVTTVFDTAAWWTIGLILAFAYILSWWYDYWSHRLITDEILGLLASSDPHGRAQIPYSISDEYRATGVPADERVLQIHGASRFIVIRENQPLPYFQSHPIDELISLLADSGAPGGKAVPTPIQVQSRIYNFHVVAALIFAVIVGTGMWTIHNGVQLPEATVRSGEGRIILEQLLQVRGKSYAKPLIIVAASGGGTRAAIYTASVLEGISKLGRTGDVVLTSGVSGGGAALAYFAANRPTLIQNDVRAWDLYFDTMKQPYIQDVLNRSSEWRISTGGRLGTLLREGFERRWNLPSARTSLYEIDDIGLIFNTTLAGHLDCPATECASGVLQKVEPNIRNQTKSALAGGRLLLTNLQLPADLAGKPLEPGATHVLPVVLSGKDITLQAAAALNANFPPVFPNAAIDVDNLTRYWVTDGGAADNRGMEMMLYALRLALQKLGADERPAIYIVVADASGLSDAYTQDRGISSVSGAGSHFASHLDSELVSSIQQLYQNNPDRFRFSYVMMPDRLRESGSFGTHWMLQSRITVRQSEDKNADEATISGDEMVDVIRALHTPAFHGKLSPKACKILQWTSGDPGHSQGWLELVRTLGGSDATPKCEGP